MYNIAKFSTKFKTFVLVPKNYEIYKNARALAVCEILQYSLPANNNVERLLTPMEISWIIKV